MQTARQRGRSTGPQDSAAVSTAGTTATRAGEAIFAIESGFVSAFFLLLTDKRIGLQDAFEAKSIKLEAVRDCWNNWINANDNCFFFLLETRMLAESSFF